MPETAAHDVGSTFGKYFLMKKLAAGGMGEIFLAKQQGPAGFQKILVVKKILGHLTESKEFVEAFLGEARLAAQMNHRNIVQVFELGEVAGSYFIAMEYVQGKSLRDVIDGSLRRKEKLHPELCRAVAEQICDGASYAHNLTDMTGRSLNLVHRDLNPQNVLISYTGDVKIIDFGIAKSEMSTVKTEAGMIKGKFVYMSPEQSMAKKLDKRSDVFAIGISLYEMLTGINPFHKNNIVLTLEAVQRYEPPPPSEYDPSYALFDPIVAKALTKDRDRRYSDAAEMQDDLRRVIVARPPERLGQFMARTFRQQLEEEQKLLMDSDSMRLAGGAARRTPQKAAPAQTPSKATPARPEVASGGTELLPAFAPRKSAPTPAPPRRPQPPLRAEGAGDTLIDMGNAPAAAAGGQDEVPGGTLMLNPSFASQPLEGEHGTLILEPAPQRGPSRKGSAPKQVSTNIMTPEESEAAQEEALAKMKQAQQQVVRTRTRSETQQPPPKSGKGLWIALGVGSLVAVGGILALLLALLREDSPAPRKHRPAPSEQARAQPVEEKVPAVEERAAAVVPEERPAPKPEEKRSAPPQEKPAEQRKPEPRKQAFAGKTFGTLTLNPGPNVSVVFGATAYPKQVGAFMLPINAEAGSIEVGDGSTLFKVHLDYTVAGGALQLRVSSVPWSIASVNGPSRGRTPVVVKIEKQPMTVLELKKPGAQTGMALRLLFRPAK